MSTNKAIEHHVAKAKEHLEKAAEIAEAEGTCFYADIQGPNSLRYISSKAFNALVKAEEAAETGAYKYLEELEEEYGTPGWEDGWSNRSKGWQAS